MAHDYDLRTLLFFSFHNRDLLLCFFVNDVAFLFEFAFIKSNSSNHDNINYHKNIANNIVKIKKKIVGQKTKPRSIYGTVNDGETSFPLPC